MLTVQSSGAATMRDSFGDSRTNPVNETVFVVDDDALVRRSLYATLSLVGFKVIQFASAEQFLMHVNPAQSGCVLVDMRMPGMDGLALQEQLANRNSTMAVIIITGHADIPIAVRAMRAGAFDVLEKPFNNKALISQVKSALAVAAERTRLASTKSKLSLKLESLSRRERDVLNLVVEGYTNRETAAALAISSRTVDKHRARIMVKLKVENLAELVKLVVAIK